MRDAVGYRVDPERQRCRNVIGIIKHPLHCTAFSDSVVARGSMRDVRAAIIEILRYATRQYSAMKFELVRTRPRTSFPLPYQECTAYDSNYRITFIIQRYKVCAYRSSSICARTRPRRRPVISLEFRARRTLSSYVSFFPCHARFRWYSLLSRRH